LASMRERLRRKSEKFWGLSRDTSHPSWALSRFRTSCFSFPSWKWPSWSLRTQTGRVLTTLLLKYKSANSLSGSGVLSTRLRPREKIKSSKEEVEAEMKLWMRRNFRQPRLVSRILWYSTKKKF
jgi:hypothetical protein